MIYLAHQVVYGKKFLWSSIPDWLATFTAHTAKEPHLHFPSRSWIEVLLKKCAKWGLLKSCGLCPIQSDGALKLGIHLVLCTAMFWKGIIKQKRHLAISFQAQSRCWLRMYRTKKENQGWRKQHDCQPKYKITKWSTIRIKPQSNCEHQIKYVVVFSIQFKAPSHLSLQFGLPLVRDQPPPLTWREPLFGWTLWKLLGDRLPVTGYRLGELSKLTGCLQWSCRPAWPVS